VLLCMYDDDVGDGGSAGAVDGFVGIGVAVG